MVTIKKNRFGLLVVLCWAATLGICASVWAGPGPEGERPGEPELTAVFLVSGIYPGTDLQLEILHIHHSGPAVFPDESQLLANVGQVYAPDPWGPYYDHQAMGDAGHYRLFIAEPMDFGAVTLVDLRDGTVVFASGVVWMGLGETVHPVVSTHPWSWESGPAAVPPQEQNLMANPMWNDGYFGSQSYLAQVALDDIRQTDVMRSFGSSAPYQVTSFLHTPTVGMVDPTVAVQVLVVTGHAAPPWGPGPVDTTPTPWDLLKSLYR